MILNDWGNEIIWMKMIIPLFDLLQVIVKLFKQICHRKWHFSWYGVFCYVFFFARFFFFLAIINFWTSHFRMVQKFITSRSYVINGPSKRRVIVYTAPLHRLLSFFNLFYLIQLSVLGITFALYLFSII